MKLTFDKANKGQLEAISTTEGPLLIIAGLVTGNTYTLKNQVLNNIF